MEQFRANSRWQFLCAFRKEWVNTSEEEDQILKAAYMNCSEQAPTHQYNVNNLKIKVDFSEMTRMNLASERVFELKLAGGQLPFPPPGPAGKKKNKGKTKSADPEGKEQKDPERRPSVAETLAKLSSPAEMKPDDAVRFDFKPNWSGSFECTLELEDREDWGRITIYKMFESGVTLESIDPRFLVVTDKRGRSVRRDREEMRELLDVARSYPVKISYNPPEYMNPKIWNHSTGEKMEWELQNLLMSFIKWSITGPGAVNASEIKYHHHKCIFERYQLYVGESDFWHHDAWSEEEFYLKFPEMAPVVSLAIKVGPLLRDVFRGKEEILNILFGA